MRRGALAVLLFSACTSAREPAPAPTATLGGTSSLVAAFERVGAETGLPPELLAALSYVQTRFAFADSDAHGASSVGLLGLSRDDLAAGAALAGLTYDDAISDPVASLRAGAALFRSRLTTTHSLAAILDDLSPSLRAAVRRALVRGVDGRDDAGLPLVIAARPELRERLGELTQAVGLADYEPALWEPAYSGNYRTADRGTPNINEIIIHNVEGSYSSCINWFKNPDARVSAHYVIRSTDGEVTQMVAEKNIAFHDACNNDDTLGIEHEGYMAAPERWFTETMYASSAKLVAYMADKYGIPKTREFILGHGEADDCSTHTDPGPGWNWSRYMDLIQTSGAPQLVASNVAVASPQRLASGERATVTLTITNDSNIAWDLDATRLGTAAPHDRASDFFADGDWIDPTRATGIDERLEPGATGTFTFDVVAPQVTEPTVFDEAFQLVHDNTTWFGPEIHVMFNVVPETAATDSAAGCSTTSSSAASLAPLLAFAPLVLRRRRRH